MKLACLLSLALLSAPAAAESLGVAVVAPEAELDAAAVRIAIAQELAVDISDASEFAPRLGRLEISVIDGDVRIAYHPAAGTVIERTLALPVAADERVELIAFVATNLVRDQAGELLEALQPPVVVIPPPAPPPSPPRVAPSRRIPATLGFIPPASVDSAFGERVTVGVGLHALVGMTTASDVVSISGLVDVQREHAHGAQIGGIAAVAGRARAAQIGGIAAVSYGRMDGAQIGGIGTYGQSVGGAQVAGIGAISGGRVDGLQIGGIGAVAGGDVEGLQIGGIGTIASGRIDGAQIGGITTIARDVEGVQVAGIAAIARKVEGVQIGGIATIGGDVRGVQIGVVNHARRMRGVQLGVVNTSTESDGAIPIGLFNYARDGRVAAEGWVESSKLSALAVRHGTRHVHNVWAVARSADNEHTLVGAGLGVHLPHRIDIDAMYWLTDVWDGELHQLSQLRASIAFPVASGVEVFGGAAANVYVSDDAMDENSFYTTLERRTTTDDGDHVVAWPSVFAGVRLRAR